MISGRRIGVRSGNCNYCQWSLGLNCGCRSDNYRRPALQRAPLVPNVGPDNAPTPQFWEFLGHDGSLVRWLKWIGLGMRRRYEFDQCLLRVRSFEADSDLLPAVYV